MVTSTAMQMDPTNRTLGAPLAVLLLFISVVFPLWGQDARVLAVENIAETAKGGGSAWTKASTDQSLAVGDRFRTRQRSRATLRLADLYTMRLEQFTTIQLTKAMVSGQKPRLDLSAGAVFIFSRTQNGDSGEIDITTDAVNGASKGTQIYAQVDADGKSKFQVLEGRMVMQNPQGRLVLEAGEAGEAMPGQAPKRTAAIIATNLLQWALYYPAVLDPAELGMSVTEKSAAAKSLEAYKAGDLIGALEFYPEGAAASAGGRLYHAGVLLGVGRVDEANAALKGIAADNPGRRAIERMIAGVKFEEQKDWNAESIKTAGEALGESYYLQSRSDLIGAREAANLATRLAPENGFAWTRLAELEFSFSRARQSAAALENALRLTPRNAQAHALKGFVLSADNEIAAARESFEHAVQLDGALGNAWLGLGLTKIKRGELMEGRADLQAAATVEPTVSVFHSYLGKAFSMENRPVEARKDLDLAMRLDPNDPTPLLYSALELQQLNRSNEAITDLEKSKELNDNRRVYRSQQLLDQDKAVRGANLARIYQNAGMRDVALREATRAVESDYTNPSAHLFLSNAFDALRDPNRVSLRYETPWFNELLLSSMLSPVGGGPLSQFVSQQEYSKLLEEDGIGGSLTSDLRSDGELRSVASVFGTSGDFSYGVDANYRYDSGDRLNSESDLQELYAQFKWQPTPDDVFYFLGKWSEQDSGDLLETFNNRPRAEDLDFSETQDPGLLLAGWNHRWRPGSHTLALVGRLGAEQQRTDPSANQILIRRSTSGLLNPLGSLPAFITGDHKFTDDTLAGSVTSVGNSLVYRPELIQAIQPYLGQGAVSRVNVAPFSLDTRISFEIYTAEIQQIEQSDTNLLVAGARVQAGSFETVSRLSVPDPDDFFSGFAPPASVQNTKVDFDRITLYGYDYWSVTPQLTLIGGVTWDHIDHPENFRRAPVSAASRTDSKLSGKFGFTYEPSRYFMLRGLYSEALGGVTFDESIRLEPVQLAGFNQAYRTVISESLQGSVEAPRYQIMGISVEGSAPSRTWWGASLNVIEQEVDRTVGAFTGYASSVFLDEIAYFADSTIQTLDYREVALGFNMNQLIGDEFAVGAGYRITRSELLTQYPELIGVPERDSDIATSQKDKATLHEVMLNANWNSPTGLFATAEANWFMQDLDDDPLAGAPRSGDEFWQFNAFVGYRFNRNLCEVSAGVLNITDNDYRMSPLSPYGTIARDRTAVLRCRFSF